MMSQSSIVSESETDSAATRTNLLLTLIRTHLHLSHRKYQHNIRHGTGACELNCEHVN